MQKTSLTCFDASDHVKRLASVMSFLQAWSKAVQPNWSIASSCTWHLSPIHNCNLLPAPSTYISAFKLKHYPLLKPKNSLNSFITDNKNSTAFSLELLTPRESWWSVRNFVHGRMLRASALSALEQCCNLSPRLRLNLGRTNQEPRRGDRSCFESMNWASCD